MTKEKLKVSAHKYKFIHILYAGKNGWLFIKDMMEMLNDETNGFKQDEQLFVTSCEPLFQLMKEHGYTNISYFPNRKNNSVRLINYYGKKGDWLFVHGMTGVVESFLINPLYRKKIIWRTWGHDTGYIYDNNIIKNIPKYILNSMYRHVVRSFHAVGISPGTVDKYNIESKFGNVKIVSVAYGSPSSRQSLVKVLSESQKEESSFNILLGHSGHRSDHHIEILKTLERFKDENIKVFLPLAYGSPEYINEIKENVDQNIWGNKLIIIDRLYPFEDYVRFLKKMNLAVLDVQGSAALGTFDLLRVLGKAMCVNRDGLIHISLNQAGIAHFTTDELSFIPFSKLCEPIVYTDKQKELPGDSVELWKDLYHSLL